MAGLAAIAALGLLVFLGQESVNPLAARAEAKLEDRFLAAREHNEKIESCVLLLNSVHKSLQAGVRPEDKQAFAKALASESSAVDAVTAAERYLREQGLASAPTAASQPVVEQDEKFVLW